MPPSPKGRIAAAMIGLFVGSYFAYDAMSDYQLIQRLDDPNERDENGEPIKRKFKVTFQQTSPLKLKPEAEERMRKEREALENARATEGNSPESSSSKQ